ncbi:MAG: hypothetical protein R3B84_02455 [Zavarzinella sp.]
MAEKQTPGGIVHTYLGYDPVQFPSPRSGPPDVASAAMDHLLYYGGTRKFTEEELANAVDIDPSMIQGLGPSIEALRQLLLERKRKILETYETGQALVLAGKQFRLASQTFTPPLPIQDDYFRAVDEEQLRDLEDLYYDLPRGKADLRGSLMGVVARLAEKYQVERLAANYKFTGREGMDVPKALEIKEELETIDELLKQLEEAAKNAKLARIDMEALQRFINEADLAELRALQQQVQNYLEEMARQQGLDAGKDQFQITPKAYRLFQNRLLQEIFQDLQASRSGRHPNAVPGEGAVETSHTKEYEFGDSIAQMDIPSTMINALLRHGQQRPVRISTDDIVIHRTQVTPKAATAVLLDMSGSMRYGDMYYNVKRMGMALEGLIRKEYPGDYLQFIEMFTFAKPCKIADLPYLLPKPVSIYDPIVRMKADMSDPGILETQIPQHFTNIQHALRLGRQFLCNQPTNNRQMFLITDGLPTAHFEENILYLMYPPSERTESATMREALKCAKEGITINLFLIQSWSQSEEDVRFAHRMASATKGRVIFCSGNDLDRFVLWDYIQHKKSIIN